MKIGMYKSEDPMEGDFGIELKIFKETTDKDFDLRMWRLIHDKEGQKFIIWSIFNLSKGNVISSESFRPDELKNIKDKITSRNKRRIKEQKTITGLAILFGLSMVISPLWNPPDAPNMWIAIFGYIIVMLSTVTYGLIDFDNKEK